MASIRKVPTRNGFCWQARWRENKASCAKNFSTKAAAATWAARMTDLVEHRGVGADRITVSTWLDQLIEDITVDGAHSPATIASYRKMAKLANRVLGQIRLSRLTTAAIDNGYWALLGGAKPVTPYTVGLLHRILTMALGRATKRGLISYNPATNATPPSTKPVGDRKICVFSPAELKSLLAAAERDPAPDTITIVMLLLATGLRRSEILGLRLDNIDFDRGFLDVRNVVIEVGCKPVERARGKSAAAERTIALPPKVVTLLRAQRARVIEMLLGAGIPSDKAYLFPGPMGAPMPPPWPTRRLKRLMRAAGITDQRSPTHIWRHTSATLSFEGGANAKVVQARLGHSNIHTTLGIYVHATTAGEREAADHFERLLTKD